MRFQLVRLMTEPALFDPIQFSSGINLILGEKVVDQPGPQGRKVNGVGKSLCVEFIHFGLLREFADTRVSRIPRGELPESLTVVLDVTIGAEQLQIRRDVDHPNEPLIVRNGENISFQTLDDATVFLGELLFSDSNATEDVSFRSLMTLLMRDETSGFSDILRPLPARIRAPGDRLPHLYLLGLGIAFYRDLLGTIKKLDDQVVLLGRLKDSLTSGGSATISEVAGQLSSSAQDVARIEKGLREFRAEPAFAQVEKELNDIEVKLNALRARRKGLSFQLAQIDSLPRPESIDETDIAILYNKIKAGMGDLVIQSLDQAKRFKSDIESFQRSLLNEERERLEGEIEGLTNSIGELSDRHASLIGPIDKKGVVGELSAGFEVALQKQQDFYRKKSLFEQFQEAELKKEELKSDRQNGLAAMVKHLNDSRGIESSFNNEISRIHERVMGTAGSSFRFDPKTGANVKQPLDLDLRIPNDGSLSVDRTKVFIYDCALMFAECTKPRHPRFLLHDNIFDVDQDTLVQCLNFLVETFQDDRNFQYVLTLNREKVEAEERSGLIKLDVKAACKARLTKAEPLLRFRYQEIRRPNPG